MPDCSMPPSKILSWSVLVSKCTGMQAAVLGTQAYTFLRFLFSKWRITLSNRASFHSIILHKDVHRHTLPFVSLIQQAFILSPVSKALGQEQSLKRYSQ